MCADKSADYVTLDELCRLPFKTMDSATLLGQDTESEQSIAQIQEDNRLGYWMGFDFKRESYKEIRNKKKEVLTIALNILRGINQDWFSKLMRELDE